MNALTLLIVSFIGSQISAKGTSLHFFSGLGMVVALLVIFIESLAAILLLLTKD